MSETKMENEIDIAINSLDEAIEEHNRDAKVAQNRALYGILILASVFMMILMLSGVGSIAKVDTLYRTISCCKCLKICYRTEQDVLP
mgnify:CR=1 FL=1